MFYETKEDIAIVTESGEYKKHFVQIDADVVNNDLEPCPRCDSSLHYQGWKRNSEYWAFAICEHHQCNYAVDF